MEESKVFPKMFTWLGIGLLVSFLTGYLLSNDINFLYSVLQFGLWPIIILEFGIAIGMGLAINKMCPTVAGICYIIYCFVTGLTLSTLFILFDLSSIPVLSYNVNIKLENPTLPSVRAVGTT